MDTVRSLAKTSFSHAAPPAEAWSGCSLEGVWEAAPGGPLLRLRASNSSAGPVGSFMVQFNKNGASLAPAAQAVSLGTIAPGATFSELTDRTGQCQSHNTVPLSR